MAQTQSVEEIEAQLFFRTDEELRQMANASAEILRQHQQATFLAEFNDGEKPALSEAQETALLTGQLAQTLYQNRRLERDAYGENPDEEPGLRAAL